MHIGYSLFHWFILPWKSLYADKIVLPSKSGLLPNAGERFTPSSSATQLTADPLGTAEPLRTRLNGMESNLYIYRGGLGALILTTGGPSLSEELMNRERMGAWALGVFTLHLAEQVADLAELGQSCHGCHLPFSSKDVV